EEIRLEEGWAQVEGVVDRGEVATVYNLEVDEYHTYFVGCDEWGFAVWAHNADGYGPSQSRSRVGDKAEQEGYRAGYDRIFGKRSRRKAEAAPKYTFEVDWPDPRQRSRAENWCHAKRRGYPTVLTWAPTLSKSKRDAAQEVLKKSIPLWKAKPFTRQIGSPDEYPPCGTREGGASAWIGHIQSGENSNQGARLSNWARAVGIQEGDRFT